MKRLLIFMQMLIAFAAGVSAQETLTVCDGTTTNSYFPFNGSSNMDGAQKSQMLYAADELSAMNGKKITSITFYATASFGWADNGAPENTWNLAEVDNASFTSAAFISAEFAKVATTKGVKNADNSWTITFDTPYVYNGGNLLIQGEMPQGYNGNQTFYGANQANYMSYVHYEDGYGGDNERSKFSPKVTFTYEADQEPGDSNDPVVVTFDFLNNPWGKAFGNCPNDTFIASDGATTISFIPGGTSTYTIQYKMTDNQLRVYKDDKIVITAPTGKVISKLDFVYSGANDGGLGSSITFDEPAETEILTLTGNARWTQIDVTLVPVAGGDDQGDGDNTVESPLTVFDGTAKNANVPFAGFYLQDGAQTSQMIYPAAALAGMKDKAITSMTFYYDETFNYNNDVTWSVAEVEQSSFASAALATAEMTQVAVTKGTFDNAAKTWTITFDTPYIYKGGNLLIQGAMPQDQYGGNMQYFGAAQEENTAVLIYKDFGYDEKGAYKFLPKTSFAFEEPVEPEVIPEGFHEVADYVGGFEDVTGSSYNATTAPFGWGYIGTATSAYSRNSTKHGGSYAVSSTSDNSTKAENELCYIVTPAVKGDVKVWARAYTAYQNSYNGTQRVKAYKVTKNEAGEFVAPTADDLLVDFDLELDATYKEITIAEGLPKYTYVAIALSRAYIDDLSVTSAIMPDNPGMQVTAITGEWSDSNPLFASMEGKATYSGTFKVKNSGDVALVAGRTNYSVTITSQSTTQITIPETIIPMDFDLAVGEESAEIPFSVECTLVNPVVDGRSALRVTSNLLENGKTATTNTSYKQTNWFTLKTVTPQLEVRYVLSETAGQKMADNPTELGLVDAPASATLQFRSIGGSPVVLKNIVTTCEGVTFAVDGEALTFPYTIEKGVEKNFTLTFNNTGGQSTTLDFVYGNTYDETEYHYVTKPVSAVVKDTSLYFEDFESYLTVPTGWCQPGWVNEDGSNWSFSSSSSNTYATNGLQNVVDAKLISPKLTLAEGQTLTIAAQPKTNPSNSDCHIKVYYSADRVNWTLGGYIGYVNSSNGMTKDSGKDIDPSLIKAWAVTSGNSNLSNTYCKAYVIDGIPAGDWYIGFESGYSIIDYVFGGKLTTLENDIYVGKMDVEAGESMVNHAVTVSVKYSNMLATAAADRTVTLYNGDEQIEQYDGVELDGYASDVVAFTFTPHVAGDMNLKVVIANTEGEYSVETAPVALTIAEESMISDVLVGERTSSTSVTPLSFNWYNARGEWIWDAEHLGLAEGDVVNSLTLYYYNTVKDLPHKNVKIYLVNTEDATVGSAVTDVTEMTPVFADADYTFQMAGSSSEHAAMTFNFAQPFTYTGGNIHVIFISEDEAKSAYNAYYFETYSAAYGASNYVRYDTYADFIGATSASSSTAVPVASLGLVVSAPVIEGTVTSAKDGVALEGATIEIKSGDVIYTATTDVEGHYSIEVMQPALVYTITVSATDHITQKIEEVDVTTYDGGDFVLELDPATAISNINVEYNTNAAYNLAGQRVNANTKGIVIINGKKYVVK